MNMNRIALRFVSWLAVRLMLLAAFMVPVASFADVITYYHNDLVGSPILSTGDMGQVLWRESYRPYGERLTKDPAADANGVWFGSRQQDAGTGLVYMGARHYDPVIGRFVSVDAARFDETNPQSFNRYAYANNSPYRYVDPDGNVIFLAALIPLLKGAAIWGAGGFAATTLADSVSQYAASGQIDPKGAAMEGLNAAPAWALGGVAGEALVVATTLRSVAANKSAGQYLFETWHQGTFPNRAQSVAYHLERHGKGRSATEYTRDAMSFFERNKHLGEQITLKDGSSGIRIQTKQIVDGKVQRTGGYWTSDGKLVTFWD